MPTVLALIVIVYKFAARITLSAWAAALAVALFLLNGGFRTGWRALVVSLAVFAGIGIVIAAMGLDRGGLPIVDTRLWGGLLVTLVVSVTGIVASMPIGIALALGRRSTIPLIRVFSVAFIFTVIPLTIGALALLDRTANASLKHVSWVGEISYSSYLLQFPVQLAINIPDQVRQNFRVGVGSKIRVPILDELFEQLREGQPVTFDATKGDKGLRAENVHVE